MVGEFQQDVSDLLSSSSLSIVDVPFLPSAYAEIFENISLKGGVQ